MAQKPIADSLSDRLHVDLCIDGDKPDTKGFAHMGSPVSPLRHPNTSSSSSSSGSGSGKLAAARRRSDPGRTSHSGELSGSSKTSPVAQAASRPSHRRSGSGPLVFSSTANSPTGNVLPCGNICPSGRIANTGMTMMSRSTAAAAARSDVLGSGTGNYGHGSIIRGGGAAASKMDPEEITGAGNEHYKRGQFTEALRLYDRAVTMCSEKAACRGNRAAALAALGRLGEAVKDCEEAVRLDNLNARAHHWLAALHLRLGHVETARQHLFMSGRSPDPVELQKLQDVERHLVRCADARKLGDWKGALRAADAAVVAGADASPLLAVSRTEAFLRLHRLEDADSAMSNASKLAGLAPLSSTIRFFGLLPDSYFHIVRAQVEMALGRFENAVASAEKAEKVDPRNAEVALISNNVRAVCRARARGNELFNAGKFSEACFSYGEGLEYDPLNPVLYCNRAACRFKLGQWAKSIEDCNEALKIQPSYTKALLRRAASYGKLEHWAEAVRDYKVLRKELPDDTEVAESLFYAQIGLKTSCGEEVSNVKFGCRVKEITSLEQFQAAVSLPGVCVVHFLAASNPQCRQIAPFVDQLSINHPAVNFLKVDIGEVGAIAKSENVRIVPTFKIYKNGAKVKEMICPSQQVLVCSVMHYGH